jgi:hypothetical protein
MPVIFRRGTEADARAAADLWLRARKAAIDVIPPPVHHDDEVRAWFASHVVAIPSCGSPKTRQARWWASWFSTGRGLISSTSSRR